MGTYSLNLEASTLTAAAAVTLRLIGDFELDCGGAPVPVRRYGQRLMAVLGLSPRPVPRSRIAGLLWAAKRGNGDREAEAAAREYFSRHGHWPDEAPGTQPHRG